MKYFLNKSFRWVHLLTTVVQQFSLWYKRAGRVTWDSDKHDVKRLKRTFSLTVSGMTTQSISLPPTWISTASQKPTLGYVLVESKLNNSLPDVQFQTDGYRQMHRDRDDYGCRLIVYLPSDTPCHRSTYMTDSGERMVLSLKRLRTLDKPHNEYSNIWTILILTVTYCRRVDLFRLMWTVWSPPTDWTVYKPANSRAYPHWRHSLSETAPILSHPLSIIFNKSLSESHLPQTRKEGNITPIHKKGTRPPQGIIDP